MAKESTWFKTDHFYHVAKQLGSMISGCCQRFCQKIVMLSSHNQVTNWRREKGTKIRDILANANRSNLLIMSIMYS